MQKIYSSFDSISRVLLRPYLNLHRKIRFRGLFTKSLNCASFGTFHVCSAAQGWASWLQVVGRGNPLSFDVLVSTERVYPCLLIKRIEVSLALLYVGSDMRLQVRLLGSINFLTAQRGLPLATHGQQSTDVPWLVQYRYAHATAHCASLVARPP